MTTRFVCSRRREMMEGMVDSHGFCSLGDKLNAGNGCEVAVTARVRIDWVRFMGCRELLLGNRFVLKMKGKVYRCYIRSVTLY